MAVTTLVSVKVDVKLDNGTDAQGNLKTVSTSIGSLSKNNFDADKVLAIVGALEPCLSKSVTSLQKTETSNISAA